MKSSTRWVLRIAGLLLLAGAIAYLALYGRPLWTVLKEFYVAGMRLGGKFTLELMARVLGQAMGALVAIFVGILLLKRGARKGPAASIGGTSTELQTEAAPSSGAGASRASKRWSVCNVLEAQKDVRHLWQFSARSFNLQREEEKLPSESLSAKTVSKDWNTLFQPKLNVAWLPANSVFLRVLQLPPTDTPEETASMVELQLEKVSPLPTAQAVWTFDDGEFSFQDL